MEESLPQVDFPLSAWPCVSAQMPNHISSITFDTVPCKCSPPATHRIIRYCAAVHDRTVLSKCILWTYIRCCPHQCPCPIYSLHFPWVKLNCLTEAVPWSHSFILTSHLNSACYFCSLSPHMLVANDPKGNGEPQVSCFLNSRVTVNKVLGVHSFNPTTYGQNSDTAPNCYVCKLEKLHTIFKAYYKTLYRITGKATNFKWGQYKKEFGNYQ